MVITVMIIEGGSVIMCFIIIDGKLNFKTNMRLTGYEQLYLNA